MNRNFDNRDKYLLGEADTEHEITEEVQEKKKSTEEYYELPPAIRSRNLIWSVISLVAGILSILLCPFYYVSLVLALVSIGGALLSRRNFGFFDNYAVVGLIFGIMGVVCGLFSMCARLLGIF